MEKQLKFQSAKSHFFIYCSCMLKLTIRETFVSKVGIWYKIAYRLTLHKHLQDKFCEGTVNQTITHKIYETVITVLWVPVVQPDEWIWCPVRSSLWATFNERLLKKARYNWFLASEPSQLILPPFSRQRYKLHEENK